MENKNLSIYELIKSSIQSDGSLPKDFSLPQEETDGISWADGAMDGVFLYHTARNEDSIEPLKDIIFQISEGKFEEADNNLRVIEIRPGMVHTEEFSLNRLGSAEMAAKVYEGVEKPLVAEDVAQTVVFALNVPHHVNLDCITLRPVAQASQFKVIRNK